jgi:putative transposase
VRWLVQAFGWVSGKASVGPELLVQLLVRAAAEMRSLSAIVLEAVAVPSLETVRLALALYLPKEPLELLPATTRALHTRLPKSLRKRPRTMAIDFHLRPYYGDKRTPGTYRGQPKASTKTFFAYATLMVIRCGQTFTVGLTPIVNGEEQTTIIERLLQQARQAGLRVRRLLLDRGFYAATTIAWLQEQSLPFIMPMIRRGRSGKKKSQCTGTAQFFVSRRRGWTKYTWTARPRRGGCKQAALTVTIDVCMVPRSQQVGGRRRRRKGPLVYACHGIPGSTAEVYAWYRKRFRIETSYRQLGQGLAMTCSKDPVYRLLLAAIALVLRNLWVWLHWMFLAEPTSKGRELHLERLRLRTLTRWLIQALDELLGMRTEVVTT